MKHFLLTLNGELVYRTGKATWTQMNEANTSYCKKEEKTFLSKYGLIPTIFNVANLQKWGEIPLTPHYAVRVLKYGATATEEVKQKLALERAKQIAEREVFQ